MRNRLARAVGCYAPTATHEFSASVNFRDSPFGGDPAEHERRKHTLDQHMRTKPNPGFSFERYIRATAVQPSHQRVGYAESYQEFDMPMEYGDQVLMTMTLGRWNLSPQRGREQWDEVMVDVFESTLEAV